MTQPDFEYLLQIEYKNCEPFFSPADWYYVPTELNPADYAEKTNIWLSGPMFLKERCLVPFSDSHFPVALTDPEQQFKSVLATNVSSEYESILRSLEVRCSSWRKMKRVILYVLRFIRYCQKKRYQSEEITVLELEQYEKAIIKSLQEQYLSEVEVIYRMHIS